MSSWDASAPQATHDFSRQPSRPSRSGFGGIKKGTVASRIQACNDREARAGEPPHAAKRQPWETKHEERSQSTVSQKDSSQTPPTGAKDHNPEIRSDRHQGDVLGRTQSGQSEGYKVCEYPERDVEKIREPYRTPAETHPLRRVASSRSVRYTKPTPTAYTTEREKSGSYVVVGPKHRSNVDATSPYALMIPNETKATSSSNLHRSMPSAVPQGCFEQHEEVRADSVDAHDVDNMKGAYDTLPRPFTRRSLIPVYRETSAPVRNILRNTPQHRDPHFRPQDEHTTFVQDINKIIEMLDIIGAEHVHQIRRIAWRLSPATMVGDLSDDRDAKTSAQTHGIKARRQKIIASHKLHEDLQALVELIETSADTWADSRERRSIEAAVPPKLEQVLLAERPPPLFATSGLREEQSIATIETGKPSSAVMPTQKRSPCPQPEDAPACVSRPSPNTRSKVVTFTEQAGTWTPLPLN